MKWVLGTGKEIAVNVTQLKARIEYIRQITEADVSDWKLVQVNDRQFLYCTSDDIIDGVFITAHIQDVYILSTLDLIYENRIIIANTCIWNKFADKKLLYQLQRNNQNFDLYFAKQELLIDPMQIFRQTTTLLNVGQFGFQTSLSERELFINRRKGFEEALKQSFKRVSPIFFTGE